jgi:hypothetical protein
VGWAITVGDTKGQFQTANLLEVDFKAEFYKFVMFQNVLMDPKISKEKPNLFIFFQCLLRFLCPFNLKNKSLCFFNFIQI